MGKLKNKMHKIENKAMEEKGKIEGRTEQMKKEAEERSVNEE